MLRDQDPGSLSQSPYAAFDVVVMAASLGGIQATSQVLSRLPANFPVPIVVVQHLHPTYPSQLAELLNQRTPLSVQWAQSQDRLRAGTVYVAPPDRHVLVTKSGLLILSQSPKEQFVRPAANVLFESVARCYRAHALAVVLTGTGRDGARGVQAIKQQGGSVLVQNMKTSRAFSMPSAALKTGCVDFALSLHSIASALVTLCMVKGAAELFALPRVRGRSTFPTGALTRQ
jgi:two-component system chemotaxis response regulator CheB